MPYIAGVDIGNNTTEVAICFFQSNKDWKILSTSLLPTFGIKGTLRNVPGIIDAIDQALHSLQIERHELHCILMNEATPVIGDVAMETVSETVITESAMIGHNPSTPGGLGLGIGRTVLIDQITNCDPKKKWIVIVPETWDFESTAHMLNAVSSDGIDVVAGIVQKNDGVLINNRLQKMIPLVDEVQYIDKVPKGMPAAVEVAQVGKSVQKLSNPYDIATLFSLSPEETRNIVPIARALTGTRSAVVIKTPQGDIQERRIPAGKILLIGQQARDEVEIEEGAEVIMHKVRSVWPLQEVSAQSGTNVGGMFENVRQVMADLTDQPVNVVRVQDILAVDTLVPQQVIGSLAGEYSLGNAVGLAAMVETQKLPMQRLARKLHSEVQVAVDVAGVEAEMAITGALTTPGLKPPLAILDLGGGSTDASLIKESGQIRSVHLAGAGDMVSMLIDKELGLNDMEMAECIKFYPLAQVQTLFHIRHEDGSVQFFEKHLDAKFFGRVVVISDQGPIPVTTDAPLAKIQEIRQKAKKKVFVQNALRALEQVAPANNIRLIHYVALVGGSAQDFEIPGMISDALVEYGVVTGRANVRGQEGPRNAVATGLVLTYVHQSEEHAHGPRSA